MVLSDLKLVPPGPRLYFGTLLLAVVKHFRTDTFRPRTSLRTCGGHDIRVKVPNVNVSVHLSDSCKKTSSQSVFLLSLRLL